MRAGVICRTGLARIRFYNPKPPIPAPLIAAQPEPDISRPSDLDLVAKLAQGSPRFGQSSSLYSAPLPCASLKPGHKVRCQLP